MNEKDAGLVQKLLVKRDHCENTYDALLLERIKYNCIYDMILTTERR